MPFRKKKKGSLEVSESDSSFAPVPPAMTEWETPFPPPPTPAHAWIGADGIPNEGEIGIRQVGRKGPVSVVAIEEGLIFLTVKADDVTDKDDSWQFATVWVQEFEPPPLEISAGQLRINPDDTLVYEMVGAVETWVWARTGDDHMPHTFDRSFVESWEVISEREAP